MKFVFKPLHVLILSSFAMMVLFSACKKDDPAPAAPFDLSGTTWTDSANISGVAYKPFTIVFNANGSATFSFSGSGVFPGSWSKTPNSNIVYIFFDENATNKWKGEGTLNSSNTKIEGGTLTRTAPSALSGTFRVTKQ